MVNLKSLSVIAFACHPDQGSEEGVGWSWINAAKGYYNYDEIVVAPWYLKACQERDPSLNFVSIPFPLFINLDVFKFINRPFGKPLVHILIALWLLHVCAYLKRNNRRNVWMLTYVGARFGPYIIGKFPNLIWGPIGGLVTVPKELVGDLPFFQRTILQYRNINIRFIRKRIQRVYQRSHGKLFPIAAGEKTKKNLSFLKNIAIRSEIILSGPIHPAKRVYSCMEVRSKKVIFGARYFDSLKGSKFIIRLIETISERNEFHRFEFYCFGQMDAHTKNKLSALIGANNVLGSISREKMFGLYSESDIYLHFSYLDLTSTALAEASASGCVCIAFDAHEMRNVIEPDKNGFLIDPKKSLLERINQVSELLVLLGSDTMRLRKMSFSAELLGRRFGQFELSVGLD